MQQSFDRDPASAGSTVSLRSAVAVAIALAIGILASSCSPAEIAWYRNATGLSPLSPAGNQESSDRAKSWIRANAPKSVPAPAPQTPTTTTTAPPPPSTFTPIKASSQVSMTDAQNWARARGASDAFIDNARFYWRFAPAAGVRAEVAYVQAAVETRFGNFGGVIDATYQNSCGLKITGGGANAAAEAHQRFSSWEQGVQACVDHLALYAGATGFPRANTPDPRHFGVLHGRSESVEGLSRTWATDPLYGSTILKHLTSLTPNSLTRPI